MPVADLVRAPEHGHKLLSDGISVPDVVRGPGVVPRRLGTDVIADPAGRALFVPVPVRPGITELAMRIRHGGVDDGRDRVALRLRLRRRRGRRGSSLSLGRRNRRRGGRGGRGRSGLSLFLSLVLVGVRGLFSGGRRRGRSRSCSGRRRSGRGTGRSDGRGRGSFGSGTLDAAGGSVGALTQNVALLFLRTELAGGGGAGDEVAVVGTVSGRVSDGSLFSSAVLPGIHGLVRRSLCSSSRILYLANDCHAEGTLKSSCMPMRPAVFLCHPPHGSFGHLPRFHASRQP